jgi:glucose-6-phosphate isomerase
MAISQPPVTIVPLLKRPAWKALEDHSAKVKRLHLWELFAGDPKRAERFTIEAVGLYFDYSKHRITGETIDLLLELAEQSGLRQHIDAMFAGDR